MAAYAEGRAFSKMVAISTTIQAAIQSTLTFVETMLYGDVPEDGIVSGVAPVAIVDGVKISASKLIHWVRKADGTPVKGTWSDASLESFESFDSKVDGWRAMGLHADTMTTTVREYLEAGGPGSILP